MIRDAAEMPGDQNSSLLFSAHPSSAWGMSQRNGNLVEGPFHYTSSLTDWWKRGKEENEGWDGGRKATLKHNKNFKMQHPSKETRIQELSCANTPERGCVSDAVAKLKVLNDFTIRRFSPQEYVCLAFDWSSPIRWPSPAAPLQLLQPCTGIDIYNYLSPSPWQPGPLASSAEGKRNKV